MVADQILLTIDVVAAFFLLLTIILVVKNREFERHEFERSLNAFVFGLVILFVAVAGDVLILLVKVYPSILQISKLSSLTVFIRQVIDIALLPLFAICVLVSVFLAYDTLKAYPLLKPDGPKKRFWKRADKNQIPLK